MKSYAELKALIEQRGVHAEFGDAGEGWGIEQNPHELATFLVRMQELGVQSVLEIGTGYKGGLSRFLAADLGWQVTSVDVEDYGHKFEGVTYINLDNAPDDLPKHDLVFIDGNHAYETVKFDYELWGEFATNVIAFHDIAGLRGCEGVKRFWKEVAYQDTNYKLKMYGDEKTLVVLKPGFKDVKEFNFMIFEKDKCAGIGWIEL